MSRTAPTAVGGRFARVGLPENVPVATARRSKPGFPPPAGMQRVGSVGPILLDRCLPGTSAPRPKAWWRGP